MLKKNNFNNLFVLFVISLSLVLIASNSLESRNDPQDKIVFFSDRDGNNEIYVMNDDGSAQRRLTNNDSNDTHPKFSPNGEQIVFLSDRNGPYEIFTMNSDGSDVRQITPSIPSVHFPSFSADGSKLIFNSVQKGKRVLMIMDLTNGETSRYLRNKFNVYHPAWSPSGDKIAFDIIEGNNQDICVANTDGSGFMRLTENAKGNFSPAWSPDARHIAYIGGRNRNLDICVMKADGSGKKYITSHNAMDEFPSWGPDGKRIVFESRRTGKKQIFIIGSDGTGLKQITFGNYNNSFPDWCKVSYSETKKTSDNQGKESFPVLKGPYLGQKPPGMTPEVFAPGIVSTEEQYELNSVFSPDGDEFYYEVSATSQDEKKKGMYFYVIMVTRQINGIWTKPEMAPFCGTSSTMDMCFSHDGKRLYFTSDRPPTPDKEAKNHIWYVDRLEGGWSEPEILGPPIYTPDNTQSQPSIAENGTLYFRLGDDLYNSKHKDGKFSKPEILGDGVNSPYAEGKPFIAPNESCLLFIRYDMPASIDGGRGLYISFKREDGSWTPAKNTKISGSLPKITPDGKYFFFSREGDIYWVDARVIEDLKH